ncbi:glycosyltransferase involved in cell wall biosynthesis [Actinoplanes lutulentus]|uniref:Glycosyl transferase family 2 n=1 Tax=Actinoplanes lutulentus TaxID=1287878 RepID=A0A327YYK5_9ACTN|nr:glycosyltransferase family 2 protein [Actinoplanes lutulentus]MBB2942198.1 glycosyltransferase involved in cell wall biosynthesis [Actinoplanes lutulentus]RAK26848.1 glycosyl transferase family 2 [Actinoplanes lutulentus]
MNDPLISVVAPIYNEGDGVDRFLERVGEILAGAGLRHEFVLIDDGSTDDSWSRIAHHSRLDSRVRGMRLSRNFGKEAALLAGLEQASGDAVVVIDSDLQHPPAAIPAMVRRWQDGAHVVEAVKRNRTGQSLGNRLSSRVFNKAFTGLTKVDLVDATDFRLLGRPALDALLRMPEHSSFFRGTSSWIGFTRATVEIDIDHREGGASRWSVRGLCRLAVNGLTSFTSAPLHLVTMAGIGFALFSVVLGVQTLVRWVSGGSVAGFTTVILLLLVTGTFVLLGLGVIGEYLARIHEEVRGRPRYLVQERTVFSGPGEPAVPEQWVVEQHADR